MCLCCNLFLLQTCRPMCLFLQLLSVIDDFFLMKNQMLILGAMVEFGPFGNDHFFIIIICMISVIKDSLAM